MRTTNQNRHGFRTGKSYLRPLLEQYNRILDILNQGANADAAYLYFSKAFERVDHEIVLMKIMQLGIAGKIIDWLKSFLTGRHQEDIWSIV